MTNFTDTAENSSKKTMTERLEKIQRVNKEHDDYVNLDLILGSFDKAEVAFSTEKYVMTENRKSLTQLFLEIIFLKCNERFWDVGILSDEIQQALICSSTA